MQGQFRYQGQVTTKKMNGDEDGGKIVGEAGVILEMRKGTTKETHMSTNFKST